MSLKRRKSVLLYEVIFSVPTAICRSRKVFAGLRAVVAHAACLWAAALCQMCAAGGYSRG